MSFDINKCLSIKALGPNCTVALESPDNNNPYQFSLDGVHWQNNSVTLTPGQTCYVKGTVYPAGSIFNISAPFLLGGNIMSLVDDGAGAQTEITEEHAFEYLFKNLTFQSIPEGFLPATTLTKYCYKGMFQRCSSLTTLPNNLLPATELAEHCYSYMFDSCDIAELPDDMLPATTLVTGCYGHMFYDCLNLKKMTVHFTDWSDTSIYTSSWVFGVADEGDFYCPAGLEEKHGNSFIPSGWTVHPLPVKTKHGTMFIGGMKTPLH